MEDLIITKEELVRMFESGELKDSNEGWLLNGMYVEIVAIHETDPKYLHDVTSAQYYKLIKKKNKRIDICHTALSVKRKLL